MSDFRPGFRFSPFDAILLAGAGAAAMLIWPRHRELGFIIGFVVGHFFLFCNVFRMGRALELVWAVIFVVLVRLTLVSGVLGSTTAIALALSATVVVVALELRKPSYHGVGWSHINPGSREWWKASVGRDGEAGSGGA